MRPDPKLPAAVRWLGSVGLFRALRSLARLAVDGDAIDARDWMQPNLLVWQRDHLESLLDPTAWGTLAEAPPEGALWFDYVADLGDDGQATHDLAYLLHGDLWVVPQPDGMPATVCLYEHPNALHLPRGAFLLLGGDTAYPVATAEAIRTRLITPWEQACRQRRELGLASPAVRPLLGIPGNHDWADSLDGFGRLVRLSPPCDPAFALQPRPEAAGPLALPGHLALQSASYAAIRLPWQWDLWAVDLQAGHLDYRQRAYFQAIDQRRSGAPEEWTGHKLILLCARPVVASGVRDAGVEQELDRVIGSDDATLPPFRLRLDLAGDLHHYARYDLTAKSVAPGGQRLAVVAGGGGAFLHPTHTALGPLPPSASVPDAIDSRHAFRRLLRPWTLYNAGVLPWALLWRLLAPGSAAWLPIIGPLAGLGYGLWVGRTFPARTRWRAMVLGGLGAAVLASAVANRLSTLPPWGGSLLLGLYLYGATTWWGTHLNAAAAALRSPASRHVIRFKLEPQRLTGYVIGIAHPSPWPAAPRQALLLDTFTLAADGPDRPTGRCPHAAAAPEEPR